MEKFEGSAEKESRWLRNLRKEDISSASKNFLAEKDPKKQFELAKVIQAHADSQSEFLAKQLHEGELLYKYLQTCRDRDLAR
jgi:hypothetical protein